MSNYTPRSGIVLLLTALCIASSCTNENADKSHKNTGKQNVLKGVLNVEADAGLESIMRQEKEVFEFLYDSVQLHLKYADERTMLNDLGRRKVETMILARPLEKSEIEHLISADTLYTREIAVAYDAVALVGNLRFNDENLDLATLKEYFNPKAAGNEKLQLVFDNSNSSIVKYMLNFLGFKNKVSSNIYAVKSVQEVLNYVPKNKNAIGFIPYNFISDTDDDSVKQLYERIKVLSLRQKGPDGKEIRVSANQSDIATGDYPLTRAINVVIPYHLGDSLSWLFANFLLNGKGSKVFLKAGLIPVKRTEREIIVNTNGLKAVNQ
jgi:phosphate transport system substrate-binding protein